MIRLTILSFVCVVVLNSVFSQVGASQISDPILIQEEIHVPQNFKEGSKDEETISTSTPHEVFSSERFLITEALVDTVIGNATGIGEDEHDDVVDPKKIEDVNYPGEVPFSENSEFSEMLNEENTVANIQAADTRTTNEPSIESSSDDDLPSKEPLEIEPPPNTTGKGTQEDTIREHVEEKLFENIEIHSIIQTSSNKQNNTYLKDTPFYNINTNESSDIWNENSSREMFLSDEAFKNTNVENIVNHENVTESTFATTISPSTIQLPITIKQPQNKHEEDEKFISSKPNKSNLSRINDETLEKVPSPEKLFSFTFERTDPENTLQDKPLSSPRPDVSQSSLYEANTGNGSPFKSERVDPGTLLDGCLDCDIRILPITPLEQRSTPTVEEETLPTSTIKFGDLPEGKELQIYTLGLSHGIFIFSYISEFLSWIQPNDFPVGELFFEFH